MSDGGDVGQLIGEVAIGGISAGVDLVRGSHVTLFGRWTGETRKLLSRRTDGV